jgi:hypothetical protein
MTDRQLLLVPEPDDAPEAPEVLGFVGPLFDGSLFAGPLFAAAGEDVDVLSFAEPPSFVDVDDPPSFVDVDDPPSVVPPPSFGVLGADELDE